MAIRSVRIITFITHAMNPANYIGRPELFTLRQDQLDEVLTFVGLRVEDTGKVHRGPGPPPWTRHCATPPHLRAELRRRDTHGEVLRYCTVELLKKNNFHASLEATKACSNESGRCRASAATVPADRCGTVPREVRSTSHCDQQPGFPNRS